MIKILGGFITMNTKKNNELQNKYGHLLDNYADGTYADYKTKQEREEEARNKYGHLLDYAKPNNKIYEDIIKVDDMCRSVRKQRAEANKQADIRMQKRIEREKREQQERTDRNNAFVNSYLEKKEAERKAAEEKREKAEREQGFLDSIQRMINARDEASEMISKTNAMLQRDEERRKAHEEKMEWYRRQERKE